MRDPLATQLTARLGCRLPVIQTAMGWVSTPQLVIASSRAGAFAFLAGAVMSPAELRVAIDSVKGAIKQPFGVNFHMFQPGAAEILDIILEQRAQIRAVSFGRGPDAKAIARLRNAGILCVPTVGNVRHARKMVEIGVDMLVVQGSEGGGHTGTVASTVLLPQVLDAVKVPVVAAGGFGDGRGLAAALAYGAAGVAMGTRFLMTRDSPLPEIVKARYVEAGTEQIVVSTRIDGIPQRMIANEALSRIEQSGRMGLWIRAMEAALAMKRHARASYIDLIRAAHGMTSHGKVSWREALMAACAPMMIRRAVVDGDAVHGLMATGLIAGRLTDLPSCAELLAAVEADARGCILALVEGSPPMRVAS